MKRQNLSSQNTPQDSFIRQLDNLSHEEKQRIWDDSGKVERAFHRFWIGAIVLGILLFWVFTSSANTQIDMNAATQLQAWNQELNAFESRLNDEQKVMWQTLDAGRKREMMLKNDLRQQEGRVDLYKQDANNAAYALHQANNAKAALMRQADSQRPQQTRQLTAYGYSDRASPQPAKVLTSSETSKDWFVSSEGVFRPSQKTVNTYKIHPAPVIVEPARASMRNRITGNDFDSSLVIPEGTNLDTLQTLDTATVNATERYKQKLSMLNEQNVMNFNVDLYEVTTARQTALGWLSLPLLGICSLCGVYVFRAVRDEQRKRLEVELTAIGGK